MTSQSKVKDVHIKSRKFLSFDIVYLFHGVPPQDVIKIVVDLLYNNKIKPTTNFRSFTYETCLSLDSFEFNGYSYSGNSSRLIMGNLLSFLSVLWITQKKVSKNSTFAINSNIGINT